MPDERRLHRQDEADDAKALTACRMRACVRVVNGPWRIDTCVVTHLVMALSARRKLLHLQRDSVNEEESVSIAAKLEAHCRSLGCALSRTQQPHIRLRSKGTKMQDRRCTRVHNKVANSPFATMSCAAVPGRTCQAGPCKQPCWVARASSCLSTPVACLQLASQPAVNRHRTSHLPPQTSTRPQQLMLPGGLACQPGGLC